MTEVFLIFLFTVTPAPVAGEPAPAPINGSIEFPWPTKLGGLEECQAFKSGASFWHPKGDFHAVANCVERTVDAPDSSG